MTTILVIDDDPIIAAIIQALDPRWTVTSALDGLAGLDLLRRDLERGCPPDLVVLDITMPGFDGYDTCILIRAIAPQLPIIPFTQVRDDRRLPRYMQELQCAHPLSKRSDPGTLHQRLYLAMRDGSPARAQTTSAVFDRLLQKASEAEQQARTRRNDCIPVLLCASSLVEYLGLRQLLETFPDLRMHITPMSDTPGDSTCAAPAGAILVSAPSDAQRAYSMCQQHQRPLLIIAHTLHDGVSNTKLFRDRAPSVALGVVVADHTVLQHGTAALRHLGAGSAYAEPLLQPLHAPHLSAYVADHQLLPQLTARLAELVVLDFFGWTTAEVSKHLQVTQVTIETYWSRVAERLGCNRDMARAWVKQQVERRTCVDQLRSFLAASLPAGSHMLGPL